MFTQAMRTTVPATCAKLSAPRKETVHAKGELTPPRPCLFIDVSRFFAGLASRGAFGTREVRFGKCFTCGRAMDGTIISAADAGGFIWMAAAIKAAARGVKWAE
eukprot:9484886-Pyramimonas_sp.AAC.1